MVKAIKQVERAFAGIPDGHQTVTLDAATSRPITHRRER